MPLMDWDAIKTILLDLDGTLLDRAFDDHFYFEVLPEHYATKHGMSVEASRRHLLGLYRAAEGGLDWTDLDYWSRTLGVDVPALKSSVRHRIRPHEDSLMFLGFLRARKLPIYLVTNAHPKALAIKMAETGLEKHLDGIVTAFDVGCLKLNVDYWARSRDMLGFVPASTLYIDDDEAALDAARAFGIKRLYLRSKPSSLLPAQPSLVYRSIEDFGALIQDSVRGPGRLT
jgi:HAD superfamily hydrolase (TIGR01509 family)